MWRLYRQPHRKELVSENNMSEMVSRKHHLEILFCKDYWQGSLRILRPTEKRGKERRNLPEIRILPMFCRIQ